MKIEKVNDKLIKIYGEYGFCVFDTQSGQLMEVKKEGTAQGSVFKASDIFDNFNNLPCYVGELYEQGEYDTRETIIDDTRDHFEFENERTIEEIAKKCFGMIDWQSPSALLGEFDDQDLRTAKNRSPLAEDSLFLSANDLESFGYTFQGMIGIKRELAQIMYYRGYCTYVLYSDDTESMIEQKEDLFLKNVLYGIQLDDLSSCLNGWLNIKASKGEV